MLGALLYLRLTSFQNWLRSRLRRLRQPKYLFGALVGVAYFYFFFIRSFHRPPRSGAGAAAVAAMQRAQVALPTDGLAVASAAGAFLLLVFVLFMWVVPTQRAALGFTEAEIAFLFPAPITRRALVHFRLLSAQFRSLIGAAVMMLFTNRWGFLGGNPATHAVGWWFIFSALNLHFSGANFTLSRLSDRGRPTWRRRSLIFAGIAGVIAATFIRLPAVNRSPLMSDELSLASLGNWLVGLTETAPLTGLLWPFRVVVAPFLAADPGHFFATLLPAILIITLHYLWVVRSAVAFEDSSLDDAQRRGARAAAWRTGERRFGSAPTKARVGAFQLPGTGRPEIAFLWKNLLSTWPYFTARVFFICAGGVVALAAWMNSQPAWRSFLPGIGAMALAFAGYVLIVGPQFARQDIRSDLPRADILKTYPLAGWQIILGELLTPAAILTGILWLALLAFALTFQPQRSGMAWLTPDLRVALTLGAAAIIPVLVSLQLLVPGAAALLFPGWFQAVRVRGGGPEVVGQRMIFFFGQTLTMVLAIIPAALVGAIPLAAASLFQQTGRIALLLCGVAGAGLMLVVLLAEVAAGIWLLGRRFEKLDLSAELQP